MARPAYPPLTRRSQQDQPRLTNAVTPARRWLQRPGRRTLRHRLPVCE
jgi:hypothetical protein